MQDPIHPPGTIEETLPKEKHLGLVDMATVAAPVAAEQPKLPTGTITQLGECLNLEDIEASQHAQQHCFGRYHQLTTLQRAPDRRHGPPQTEGVWQVTLRTAPPPNPSPPRLLTRPALAAYYASAADDELTKDRNRSIWDTCRLRPRVLRDVTNADLSASLLGYQTALPVFLAPAAMGRLAHPEGERLLARAASQAGIPYIASPRGSVAGASGDSTSG